MFEDLARILWEHDDERLNGRFEELAPTARAKLDAKIRVLLARLREPTSELIAAVWDAIDDGKKAAGIRRLGPGPGGREVIAAYCDAVLAEAGRD